MRLNTFVRVGLSMWWVMERNLGFGMKSGWESAL
jgi:hypothetical protein